MYQVEIFPVTLLRLSWKIFKVYQYPGPPAIPIWASTIIVGQDSYLQVFCLTDLCLTGFEAFYDVCIVHRNNIIPDTKKKGPNIIGPFVCSPIRTRTT